MRDKWTFIAGLVTCVPEDKKLGEHSSHNFMATCSRVGGKKGKMI